MLYQYFNIYFNTIKKV